MGFVSERVCTIVKQVDTIFNRFLKGTRDYAY